MDINAAYREAGTYRGAAHIAGTTHKTVRRVIARHEAGGGAPARSPRGRNYDVVAGLVAERVRKTAGRISAKRLLPAARAAGYAGSPRNFRRLVAVQKKSWRVDHHRGRRPHRLPRHPWPAPARSPHREPGSKSQPSPRDPLRSRPRSNQEYPPAFSSRP